MAEVCRILHNTLIYREVVIYYRLAKKTGTVCYYRHFQNSQFLIEFSKYLKQHHVPVFLLVDNTMADIIISFTTVSPLTYAGKKPLGTNNLTSHIDMCQSNCVYFLMGDSNKFQILICKRQS
jgi:hypothetical protein